MVDKVFKITDINIMRWDNKITTNTNEHKNKKFGVCSIRILDYRHEKSVTP